MAEKVFPEGVNLIKFYRLSLNSVHVKDNVLLLGKDENSAKNTKELHRIWFTSNAMKARMLFLLML